MEKIESKTLTRINKTKAKNLYNKGAEVYLLPCNARPEGAWYGDGCPIKKENIQKRDDFINGDDDFDKIINNFSYYNSDDEAGRYVSYYIKKA